MSRLTLTITAFACALILMAFAAWQLMIYLHPPAWRVALWSPIAGLLHAREAGYIALWLVQFPLLAVVLVVASRRWPPVRVFFVLLAFYALCAAGAYFAVLAHPYGSNNALQRTEAGVRVFPVVESVLASLSLSLRSLGDSSAPPLQHSMAAPVHDGYDCFRELVRLLRAEDFAVTASRVDTLLHSAWTTSTELVGELGLELLAFQECGYEPVSPELRHQIDFCLSVVRRVCPGIRRPVA